MRLTLAFTFLFFDTSSASLLLLLSAFPHPCAAALYYLTLPPILLFFPFHDKTPFFFRFESANLLSTNWCHQIRVSRRENVRSIALTVSSSRRFYGPRFLCRRCTIPIFFLLCSRSSLFLSFLRRPIQSLHCGLKVFSPWAFSFLHSPSQNLLNLRSSQTDNLRAFRRGSLVGGPGQVPGSRANIQLYK